MPRRRKVLVVGAGGREHALAWRLLESESVGEVVVCPGNAGTTRPPRGLGKPCGNAPGDPRALARDGSFDLVVVGPEGPLVAGLVDELTASGSLAYGPTRAAARLEGSKAFMKGLAARYGLLTARHMRLDSEAGIERAVAEFSRPPVVKADGLCAGKGVVVAETHEEAVAAARELLGGARFGDAGRTVVLEERLEGVEASVHAITDGERSFVLASAQDHKRIGTGDTGPNTGGMGAYAPAPVVTDALMARVTSEVLERTLGGLRAEGLTFRGTLYAGLMISPAGEPYLLEFNVRFGDPETQVLMGTLDGDLAEALATAAAGRLDVGALTLANRHALCVVLAAAGYPGAPRAGDPITGLDDAEAVPDVRVYHAGTEWRDGAVVSAGGRVLGVTGTGDSLAVARERAYDAAARIHFAGRQHRSDIGWRALAS